MMILDLSEVFSDRGKSQHFEKPINASSLVSTSGSYEFTTDENNVSLTFTKTGKRKVYMEGFIDAHLYMPCDRCLEPVRQDFHIPVARELSLADDADPESREEQSIYFHGQREFDIDEFACHEILADLPMKVLCSENCKGIESRDGTDLNDDDTTRSDPRMAKILEVFKEFKEV